MSRVLLVDTSAWSMWRGSLEDYMKITGEMNKKEYNYFAALMN